MKQMLRSHFGIAAGAVAAAGFVAGFLALPSKAGLPPGAHVEQSQAAFTDYKKESPGTIRKITLADLPEPYATQSADNRPHIVPRPADAWPKALPGFTVTQYVTGLQQSAADPARAQWRSVRGGERAGTHPRAARIGQGWQGANRIDHSWTGLTQPFGIAFYPPGPQSTVRLRRQHRLRGALPLPQRRPEGARRAADHRSGHPFRRPADRRRSLDARYRLHSAMAAKCSSRWVRIPMTTMPITTRRNSIAPTSWSSIRMAAAGAFTRRASAIRWASP